jgi:hypothetical protein
MGTGVGGVTRDPDLAQAIVDMRPVYAEWRVLAKRLRTLNPSLESVAVARTRAQIADLRGRIVTRAERLAYDPAGFTLILYAEHYERGRLRRKPSATQMANALRGERKHRAEALSEAEHEFQRARDALEKRRAEDAAGRAACALYTGFDR